MTPFADILLETSQLKFDAVYAGRHFEKNVVAAVIGLGIAGDAGRLVGQTSPSTSSQNGAAGISHPPQDSATGALCESRQCERRKQHERRQPDKTVHARCRRNHEEPPGCK